MGVDPDNSHRFAGAEDTSLTGTDGHSDPVNTSVNTPILRRLTRISQPSSAIIESQDYQKREAMSCHEGQDWATGQQRPHASLALDPVNASIELDDYSACMAETKASHNIPRSYRHAMSTDPDRWMIPMQIEMDTLKRKHTWDLVKPPPGANVMDSM